MVGRRVVFGDLTRRSSMLLRKLVRTSAPSFVRLDSLCQHLRSRLRSELGAHPSGD